MVGIIPYKSFTAEELYALVLERFSDLGFTLDVLKKRLQTFDYENDVFDELGYLMKQWINSSLLIFPYLSHHVGAALMNLLRGHAESAGFARLR